MQCCKGNSGAICESLSSYARQFLGQMEKPVVESIEELRGGTMSSEDDDGNAEDQQWGRKRDL